MSEADPGASMIDARSHHFQPRMSWTAHIIRAAEIEVAIATASAGAAGEDGRREMLAVHPMSQEPGLGLAPATTVVFGVLRPGESTVCRRTNASAFAMALRGSASVSVGEQVHAIGHRDSWITPGMRPETLTNTGPEDFVYVSYSNEAYLKKLEAHYQELNPPSGEIAAAETAARSQLAEMVKRARDVAGPAIDINETGAKLLPYEHLIDPDFVDSRALVWRWNEVAEHLGLVRALAQGYTGRPLWTLYNGATGSRNGTTFSFFATIASVAPDLVGPAHRHMSSAINYILEGSGWSIVDGERMEWGAGDIMLSAPGWAPHGHATGSDGAIILTVQDHPLHIGSESLIWQENLKGGPILTLGSQAGFETNLAAMRENA
jgi:gentisate 1,2-dioxygenase